MSVPEVSVVIPTRDRSRRLPLAIRSALGQRGVRVEVLVIDDASNDPTEKVVGGIVDPRVRYIRLGSRRGVSAARNVGIDNAQASWVAFLDDDDLWGPDKLARQVEEMRRHGLGWAYVGEVIVDAELNILDGAPPPPPDEVVRLLARYNAVPAGASNVVVASEVLAKVGPFDPQLTNNEDWDMWIRLARCGPPAWVRSPLVAISIHPENASRNMPRMIEELRIIGARYGLKVDHARHFRWAAWQALLERRRAEATRYYSRAVAAGDLASVVRAIVGVVAPSYATRRTRDRGELHARDPWIAEARAWLRTVTEA